MQSISILILFWIYAVAVMGFVEIFLKPFGINISALYLSLILSMVGILLGFFFYGVSLLKSSVKSTIKIGVMAAILLLIVLTYLAAGLYALIELFILLAKIGFFLMMCIVPIVGVYSILKKQRNVILSSAVGILFFFFFVIILSKLGGDLPIPFYSENQITMLLLFFLLYICFLELGVTSIYFGSVVNKMAPNEDSDETMLLRFNQVFNRYLIQISIILVLCYLLSLFLLSYSDIFYSGELMGVDLSSNYGIFLLVFFILASAFVFWYLIPREKTEAV